MVLYHQIFIEFFLWLLWNLRYIVSSISSLLQIRLCCRLLLSCSRKQIPILSSFSRAYFNLNYCNKKCNWSFWQLHIWIYKFDFKYKIILFQMQIWNDLQKFLVWEDFYSQNEELHILLLLRITKSNLSSYWKIFPATNHTGI